MNNDMVINHAHAASQAGNVMRTWILFALVITEIPTLKILVPVTALCMFQKRLQLKIRHYHRFQNGDPHAEIEKKEW
jgi:hypothetical protein